MSMPLLGAMITLAALTFVKNTGLCVLNLVLDATDKVMNKAQ